jgi:hypothetical protein
VDREGALAEAAHATAGGGAATESARGRWSGDRECPARPHLRPPGEDWAAAQDGAATAEWEGAAESGGRGRRDGDREGGREDHRDGRLQAGWGEKLGFLR